MKTFLVNLDEDVERFLAADAQLKRYGLVYERFPAVNGKKLAKEEKEQVVNKFRWWCAIGWPVSDGQIGCALSHYGIYRRMLAERLPFVCIFEDDVSITKDINSVLNVIERTISPDRPQVILLSDHNVDHRSVMESAEVRLVRTRNDQYAEGYVITLPAARNLLKANFPLQRPCDNWKRWVAAGLIELYHAYPITCSQNRVDFTSSTVPPDSFAVADLPPLRFALHKMKRCIGRLLDRVMPV